MNNNALGVTLIPAGATVLLGTLVASAPPIPPPTILPGETIYPPEGLPVFGFSFFGVSGEPVIGRINP